MYIYKVPMGEHIEPEIKYVQSRIKSGKINIRFRLFTNHDISVHMQDLDSGFERIMKTFHQLVCSLQLLLQLSILPKNNLYI